MRVKKFIVESMPEAMIKIKKELGPDAVILNSKQIKTGGVFGLFKKKKIEVVAALDEVKRTMPERIRTENEGTTIQPKVRATSEQSLLKEIRQLQQMLTSNSFQSENDYPPAFEHIYSYLTEQEVDANIAKQLVDDMIDRNKETETVEATLKQLLVETIEDHLSINPGISFENKVVQFVGPTGVGKTTTLAKVAALSVLKHEKKIAFITTDTYRIAAIDQLKTYAKILNVPVKVAYSLSEYEEALQSFATYDLVFVDTAGRNFRDPKYIKELERMHHFHDRGIETYLVLSLTAKRNDILLTYDQFQHLPIEKVIFTKLDETGSYGNILNISVGKNKPIAYITNGQNVPDDIITPNREVLSDLLVSGYGHA